MPTESLVRPSDDKPCRIANLEIRSTEPLVLVNERPAIFTVREVQLLSLLARKANFVIQRSEIYVQIWGREMPKRNRSVDALVRKVRSKLMDVEPNWRYIHTHFGIGYRFTPEQIC
jgi:DNA-binding response OmpR family regulator